MRWMFVKSKEDNERIEYLYSFESDDLDGIISYDKKTKAITINNPSMNDKDSKWCMDRTIGKFYSFVVNESFPEKRNVITG